MGEIRFVGTGETRGYPYLVCKIGYLSGGVGISPRAEACRVPG